MSPVGDPAQPPPPIPSAASVPPTPPPSDPDPSSFLRGNRWPGESRASESRLELSTVRAQPFAEYSEPLACFSVYTDDVGHEPEIIPHGRTRQDATSSTVHWELQNIAFKAPTYNTTGGNISILQLIRSLSDQNRTPSALIPS